MLRPLVNYTISADLRIYHILQLLDGTIANQQMLGVVRRTAIGH